MIFNVYRTKNIGMQISNGVIIIITGVCHSTLGITPYAFGNQFYSFCKTYLFKISEGLFEFPLLNGQMNYENFAAFWFFYFGLLLIPLGLLVHYIEATLHKIPTSFVWSYLFVIAIGIYMIPFSGMTFIMLPHALYMLYIKLKTNRPQNSIQ